MSVSRVRFKVSLPRYILPFLYGNCSEMVRYAPFVYDAWKNPKTLAIISSVAGVDLITAMDFEIAHVNISMKSEKQQAEELEAFVEKKLTEADEGIAGCPWEGV